MEKNFVPLDNLLLPGEDPKKIRTWNPKNQEDINPGAYALEDKEIDDMYKFPRPLPKKKRCKTKKLKKNKNELKVIYPIEPTENNKKLEYLKYVKLQLKAQEQKENAIAREDIIRIREKQGISYNVMDSPRSSFTHGRKLLQVPSPMFNGEITPVPASRQASQCFPDVPKRSLLELKLPQSGVYINETNVDINSPIPCPYYNPRILQDELDKKENMYTIVDKNGKLIASTNMYAQSEPPLTTHDMCTQKYLCEDNDKPKCFDNKMITYNIENPKELMETPENLPIDLGFPVGILFGTLNINNSLFSDSSRSKQGLACVYVAFGYSYIIPESKWNIQVIDDILAIGDNVYLSSGSTCNEEKIKDEEINKKFQIMGMNIEVEVSQPLMMGQLKSNDPKLPHLYKGLCIFFRLHKKCIFNCKTTVLLICKKCDSFYIFDPNGRNEKCLRDEENGFASLLSLKTLENVTHLILNFSGFKKDYLYVLAEIKMFKLLKDEKKQELIRNCEKVNVCYYTVINKNRATILGSLTLGISCENPSKTRYAIAICCIALVYTRIDPPNGWNSMILDKLIALGNQFYNDCVKYDTSLDFTIKDVPDTFTFGPYYTEISLKPCLYRGEIKETEKLEDSEMVIALETFVDKYTSGIIQVGTCAFSFWIQNNIYYLYDPYARNNSGEVSEEITADNAACLNMHSSLASLCDVFVRNLNKVAMDLQFCIHSLKVDDIIKLITNEYRTDLNTYNSLKKQIQFLNSEECLIEEGTTKIKDETQKNDLDSPNVSDTQFIPKWNVIKEDLFELPKESCTKINKSNESLSPIPSRVPLCDLSVLTVVEPTEDELPEDVGAAGDAAENVNEEQEEEEEEETGKVPSENISYHDPETLKIVNEIIDEIFIETFTKIWKKCVKDGVCDVGPDEAKEILLKSDLNYLERLQKDLIHGKDYDNIYEGFKRFAPPKELLTLSKELLVESNFDEMPDGSYIISGSHNLPLESKDPECMVAIIGIAAIITSYKYSIHTWDSNMVDFVFETASVICRIIPESKRISILFTKPKHNFPKLKIGSQIFSCKMQKIVQGTFSDLYNMLEKCLMKIDRLLVLSSTYSFAVFKRKNFYYLYEGNPCNFVGFRNDNESGVSCFLRFNSLSHLVRRANCNKNDLNYAHSTVVSRLIIKDVTREGLSKYDVVTPSQEDMGFARQYRDEEAYEKERMIKEAKDKRFDEKMRFLKSEIDAEKKRLKKFEEKKADSNKPKVKSQAGTGNENDEEYVDGENDEENEAGLNEEEVNDEEEEVEEEDEEEGKEPRSKKQLPGMGREVIVETLFSKKPPFLIQKGYLMSETDFLYKIQGTNSLKNRCEFLQDSVRACHFVCIYAIMMLIHFPLQSWDYRKVDICIERGRKIFSKIRKFSNYSSRNLEKVLVDNNYYNLYVKQQVINLKKTRTNLPRAIEILLQSNNKYLILQFSNCSLVIYFDVNFHLFDPYPTLEMCNEDNSKVLIENKLKTKTYPDKNTASWILFPEMKYMISYIKKRTNRDSFDKNFLFYFVNIISYKKAPRKSKFANFMLDYPIKNTIIPEEKFEDPPNEQVKWLDSKQTIIWSRLNSKNIVKDKRRKTNSMWKEFDIEIPNDLYSLWGTIHPYSSVFGINRGKQVLAIEVVSCLMANIYRLDEWNSTLLDTIVIEGNTYFEESISDIEEDDYPFSIEDLDTEYTINSLKFNIYIDAFIYGTLYGDELCKFNLSRALIFFFEKNYYGIFQCMKRCLAIGRGNSGYFMYECQSFGPPLFANNQGCSYVLKCMSLKRLLHSIIMTLNIPFYNMEFTIHCVRMIVSKVDDDDDEDDETEDENGNGGENGDENGEENGENVKGEKRNTEAKKKKPKTTDGKKATKNGTNNKNNDGKKGGKKDAKKHEKKHDKKPTQSDNVIRNPEKEIGVEEVSPINDDAVPELV